MRLVTLFLIAAFAASTVDAASYQKIDGTIVDPIMNWWNREPQSYNGANLEPQATLNHEILHFAILNYVDLTGADLSYANLSHAKLDGADLSYADLTDADLTGANLSHANLSHADLWWADLSNLDLTDAYLYWVSLAGANLTNANFTGVSLNDGTFPVNLSGANLSGSRLSEVDDWRFANWYLAYYYTDNEPVWPPPRNVSA